MDTGIFIEDVIQTLIDLRLGHTGTSTIEIHYKQQEARDQRHRRRQKSNGDYDENDKNNNTLNSDSVLTIDEDVLHSTIARLSNENSSSQNDQHIFDRNYLRLINRR
ncbi:unnamed protein product [Rotaria sp. Silwood2]|nr:unnamed protein product [Rotaria sp. Silwood2]